MLYKSLGTDSRRVVLTLMRERPYRAVLPQCLCSHFPGCCVNDASVLLLALLGSDPRPWSISNTWPWSISFVPRAVTEPRLGRTDPSPGRSSAAAVYLRPRVRNHLLPSQLLFPRAYSRRVCQPTRFALAREKGQPAGFPWEVIPG